MELTSFLITVFCLIDDWLAAWPQRLRQRGPVPILADSEVLTIECVGEFLGIDTDTGLYQYFRRHWADWFPALRQVHRTTFTRQAANLWAVKQRLWQHLLTQVCFDPQVSLVDSVPIPICRFARAYRCRRLRELAAWGHDEAAKQTYLGLRAHLRVCWPGVIVDGRLAPANLADQAVAAELLAWDGAAGVRARGWVVADRAYGSTRLAEDLAVGGVWLLAPPRGIARTRRRPPPWVVGKRRRVETVIGQLVARYHLKRVWARDAWHLWSRWLRKLLSHTMAVLLCRQQGLSPLQFAHLVSP
jgi:Transposase DDE domain